MSDTATGTANAQTATANGATVSVASIDVGSAEGGTTYTLTAAGGNLVLSFTAGAVTQTESVAVNAMGANGTQAVAFSTLGVTLNLAHDANAGNVTGATIATAFNTRTIITSASSNATFRVGAEVGDDILLHARDAYRSAFEGDTTISAEGALRAAYLIGDLTLRLGDALEAARWFEIATRSPQAASQSGLVRMARERLHDARTALNGSASKRTA
ncbi:MAG: DUF2225 domain-containing protein [Dehalococcoidia bacterium]|nr:DUF2225 domain-containing protein [Dehalococcoidia bacterium]